MNGSEYAIIDNIVEKYGTPLYVVSADVLKHNVHNFKKIFNDNYPKVEVAYAYKANYLTEILRIIHGEGALAEVASGFEYDIARSVGVPGKSIIFNGPGKSKESLLKAIADGALINIDNNDELNLISAIANEKNKTLDVGIRIHADVGINQVVDRFGFGLESGEALDAIKKCVESGLLNVVCLHIHLTSYIVEPNDKDDFIPAKNIKLIWPKDAEMYEKAANKISIFAGELQSRLGIEIKYLDLGGGFPSVENLGPYAKRITEPLLSIFKNDLPVLILEPGRAIVKNAVSLITTVISSKEFINGQHSVTVDAGINSLPTSFWSMQDIKPLKQTGGEKRDTLIYGPLCLQTDIIAKTQVPELKPGDKLIAENVGAYNIPQSSVFIYPRPRVLMIEEGSERLIRREEKVEDVLRLEEWNK